MKNIFKPKIKLVRGTRLTSFLFIAVSMLVAAGVLFGANTYYNIDTGEIIVNEIQRVTNAIRATGGLIVGGGATDSPSAGYNFEVVGSSKLATTTIASGVLELTAANQVLRFTGGTNHSVGFRAPTNISTTTVYTWPGAYPDTSGRVLQSTDTGVLSWLNIPAGGFGTITAIGNIDSGDAFTTTTPGEWLWFRGATGANKGKLTVAEINTADKTWTLQNLTGVVALQQANTLTSGGIVFADTLGRLIQDTKLTYATSTGTLSLGTGSPASGGRIRLYGATSGYTEFKAADTTVSTTYTLPAGDGGSFHVLTTNGSGGLSWQSVSGVGGLTGAGTTNRITKWTAANTLGDSSILDTSTLSGAIITLANATTTISNNLAVIGDGIHTFRGTLDPTFMAGYTLIGNIVGSGTPDITGIGQLEALTAVFTTSVTSPLYTSIGMTTIASAAGQNIVLDPDSGIIRLGVGDVIQTSGGGPASRTSGEQILREMIPVFGFDLPAQTATTTYIQISRTIEDYPFISALSGTTRVHKLVFRYAASTTAPIDVRIATSTGAYPPFTLAVPASTDLNKGEATTTAVTIPSGTTAWWIEAKTANVPDTVRFYQIFLAAYDQVN